MNKFKSPPRGAAKKLREYYETNRRKSKASATLREGLGGMKLFKQTIDNTITALALGIALAYFGTCIYYLTYRSSSEQLVKKALRCAPETGSMNANEFRRCLLQQHLDRK